MHVCNDISPRHHQNALTEEEIGKSIIDMSVTCKLKGVNEVLISSLICRKGIHHNTESKQC